MFVEVILSILLIGSALLSLEVNSSIRSVTVFAGMNLVLSIFLLYLNAPYVAMFQLLVYFGVALFLLLVVVGLGEMEKGEIERTISLPGIIFGLLFTISLFCLSVLMPSMTFSQYVPISFGELSQSLWSTYGTILLILAYIIAFSVLGSLSIVSLKEEDK